MRVRALVSFVGRVGERKYRVQHGDVLTLPEGADWVRAGLVEPLEPEPSLQSPQGGVAPPAIQTSAPAGKRKKKAE